MWVVWLACWSGADGVFLGQGAGCATTCLPYTWDVFNLVLCRTTDTIYGRCGLLGLHLTLHNAWLCSG